MSMGGSTTELVHDTTTGNWIPASDDGSRVEHKTDTTVPNGAKDGEYWIVTTREGTRYFFGRHDLDGAGSRPVTDSVLTVPVFGNHPGEPCYQTSYAASSCDQGWRWNLDYVEDVHGNAMIIDWAKETNRYAKNQKFKEAVSYARAGLPDPDHLRPARRQPLRSPGKQGRVHRRRTLHQGRHRAVLRRGVRGEQLRRQAALVGHPLHALLQADRQGLLHRFAHLLDA